MSEERVTLQMIKDARQRLKGVAQQTGLSYTHSVSNSAGCQVFLKMENLQRTGSFKLRGAYNKVACLSPEERAKGVIAASAGNHAQGVA
ncbi:MAG: pyridoxal-phosphate dependent enzyme, partial [Megasphaera lornae]